MVNRNLLRQFDLPDEDLQQEFGNVFGDKEEAWLPFQEQEIDVNKIVSGKILNIVGEEVWIDVGYKSEGVIPLEEWKDEANPAVGLCRGIATEGAAYRRMPIRLHLARHETAGARSSLSIFRGPT